MKALYQNDTDRGAGYGIFRLEQVSTPDAAARYALIRSGDQKSLHPGGWEDTECTLAPDSVTLDADSVCLLVGPDVISRLDQLNTYRLVYLPSSGSVEKAVLSLGHIIYAPTGGANVVGAPTAKTAPVPTPAPEPAPVAEPAPELPPQTAKKGLPGGKFALPILIILGMAFGAYLALKDKMAAEQPVVEEPQAAAKEDPARPADKPTPAEEPAPSVEDAPPPADQPASPAAQEPLIPPLDQARQFLRSGGSADEAMTLALRLPESPEGRDATFLLAETAAEQGHAGAMLELAEFYDPQNQKPKGSILADAEQAWIWYGKAEQAGRTEAADRRATLRAWLEGEASKGSAEAADVLRRLQ